MRHLMIVIFSVVFWVFVLFCFVGSFCLFVFVGFCLGFFLVGFFLFFTIVAKNKWGFIPSAALSNAKTECFEFSM